MKIRPKIQGDTRHTHIIKYVCRYPGLLQGSKDNSTLKKVLKTYDLEKASKMKARNVLKPPNETAGPIRIRVCRTRSVRERVTLTVTEPIGST